MADDDAMRKIKQLEDNIGALQKQVASHKQVDATWKLNHTNQHQRQAVSVIKVEVLHARRAAASSVAYPHSFSFPPDSCSASLYCQPLGAVIHKLELADGTLVFRRRMLCSTKWKSLVRPMRTCRSKIPD